MTEQYWQEDWIGVGLVGISKVLFLVAGSAVAITTLSVLLFSTYQTIRSTLLYMGSPEIWNGGNNTPTITDTKRVLLIKMIRSEQSGGGGGGIQQVYQSVGDPNGVTTVTTTLPCVCVDTLTGVIYNKTDGLLTNTGWV